MHPRPYISQTQLVLWENDPPGYMRRYFYGEQGRTNRGQALGKEVADHLESGEDTGKIEVDLVLAQIPKLALRDVKMMLEVSSGRGKDRRSIPVMIKPDMCMRDYSEFYEIKTGTGPWTQRMADESDQVTFYVMGLYLLRGNHTGALIPKAELIWAPTEKRMDEDGVERPHLMGEIKRFPTTRTFADILRMEARVAQAWHEIGKAMEKELI